MSEIETRVEKSDNRLTSYSSSKDNRKSITARVKPEDLVIFNQRLKLFGFNSMNEMVHNFIKGKFPQITEDRQIDNLIANTQSNCLKIRIRRWQQS